MKKLNEHEGLIVESKNRILDMLTEQGYVEDRDDTVEEVGDILLDELHGLLEKVKR